VRDTAAFMAAAERFRPSPNLSPLGLVEHPGKKRLRIAMFTDGATGAASHPACIEAVEKAAALCEELGHRVEPIASPYDGHIVEDFFCFWGMSPWAMRFLGKRLFGPEFDYGRLDPWSMGLARDFRSKILRTPKVIWRLRRFAHTYARLFGRWDLLLTPTLASPPVELGHIAPEVDFDTAVERVMNYCAFTPAQNVSGGAAISLPLFRDEGGLPVGVHFAGPIGGDRTLLELAFELEEARPWPLISQAG
jgi:amidase